MAEQTEVVRHGRRPLEDDQPIGKRARTQSYIVGNTRAELVERLTRMWGYSSKSVTIRKLIDDAAIAAGIAVRDDEDLGEDPIVLPKTTALRLPALSAQ